MVDQELRDVEFKGVLWKMAERFHKKNIEFDDIFFQVNDDLQDAASDLDIQMGLIHTMLKYRETPKFDREQYKKFLSDLAIRAVMNIMLMDIVLPTGE